LPSFCDSFVPKILRFALKLLANIGKGEKTSAIVGMNRINKLGSICITFCSNFQVWFPLPICTNSEFWLLETQPSSLDYELFVLEVIFFKLSYASSFPGIKGCFCKLNFVSTRISNVNSLEWIVLDLYNQILQKVFPITLVLHSRIEVTRRFLRVDPADNQLYVHCMRAIYIIRLRDENLDACIYTYFYPGAKYIRVRWVANACSLLSPPVFFSVADFQLKIRGINFASLILNCTTVSSIVMPSSLSPPLPPKI